MCASRSTSNEPGRARDPELGNRRKQKDRRWWRVGPAVREAVLQAVSGRISPLGGRAAHRRHASTAWCVDRSTAAAAGNAPRPEGARSGPAAEVYQLLGSACARARGGPGAGSQQRALLARRGPPPASVGPSPGESSSRVALLPCSATPRATSYARGHWARDRRARSAPSGSPVGEAMHVGRRAATRGKQLACERQVHRQGHHR